MATYDSRGDADPFEANDKFEDAQAANITSITNDDDSEPMIRTTRL